MKKLLSVFITVFMLFSLASCEDKRTGGSYGEPTQSENDEKSNIITDEIFDTSDTPAFATPDATSEEVSDITDTSEEESLLGLEKNIVVLGDSIARGYGLDDVEAERFSAVLFEKLSRRYEQVNLSNYGIDGLDGSGLVTLLAENMPSEVASADTVIISIGGNNLLGPMSEFEGFKIISGGIDPKIFVDYFKFLFSKDDIEKKAYDYAVESITLLFKTANQVFGSEAFESLTQNASLKLSREIPEIIRLIRAENPDAVIYIQTVYNPYDDIELSFHGVTERLDLSFIGEFSVTPINLVIESMSEKYGYTVAPVHEVFEASQKSLTNAGFSLLSANFGVDPHPNADGHKLIADVYYKLLTEE